MRRYREQEVGILTKGVLAGLESLRVGPGMSPSRGADGDWQCMDPSDSGILRPMWLWNWGAYVGGGIDVEGGHWEGWYPNLAVIYIKVLGWLEAGTSQSGEDGGRALVEGGSGHSVLSWQENPSVFKTSF